MYIHIIYIMYKYCLYINNFFLKYIHACVCTLYTHNNIYITVHTQLLYKQKLLFWMRLIAINHLTAWEKIPSVINANATICTLIRIKAKEGVLASEANAEGSAWWGGVLRAGHLHQVQMTVGGDEVHAAQNMRFSARLLKHGPGLRLQLLHKLIGKEY